MQGEQEGDNFGLGGGGRESVGSEDCRLVHILWVIIDPSQSPSIRIILAAFYGIMAIFIVRKYSLSSFWELG